MLKGNHTPFPRTKLNYRCFKNLDTDGLLQDLQRVPFHVSHVFEDISEAYWAHEKLTKEVLDEHIPIKQKHKRKNSAPFMNSELRKAINYKKSLWRKFQNVKSDKNWNKYSKQRNYVTKLKRESIKLYFSERCGGGPKSKDFWPTIRPFLTNKGWINDDKITISENSKLITDTTQICEKFNTFFVNVAKEI